MTIWSMKPILLVCVGVEGRGGLCVKERLCLCNGGACDALCTCLVLTFLVLAGFRRRRRQVVVTPSPGGAECPPLEEQSECHEAQCHQWVMGPWSACLLTNPAHSCGIGYQLRNASCLDSAGVSHSNTSLLYMFAGLVIFKF